MALPGTGYRTVGSVMLEMSFHFLEDVVHTTLTTAVSAPGTASPIVESLEMPRNAVYVGAQIVVDSGNKRSRHRHQCRSFANSPTCPRSASSRSDVPGTTVIRRSVVYADGNPIPLARGQHEFMAQVHKELY